MIADTSHQVTEHEHPAMREHPAAHVRRRMVETARRNGADLLG